jgi:hypothetical protein
LRQRSDETVSQVSAENLRKAGMAHSLFRKSIQTLFCVIAFACVTSADEFARPRSAKDLGEYTSEDAIRVRGVVVGHADYFRIRRDFPAVSRLSDAEIDQWLIHNFAYIGIHQSSLNEIRNTHIPIDVTETKKAYRPKGWKRSALLEARDPKSKRVVGLMGAKGFGHGAQTEDEVISQINKFNLATMPEHFDEIRISDHSDGLMSAGEGIAETTRQRAQQLLYELQYLPLESVESYATLLYPFQILKKNGEKIRAALQLVQANVGRRDYYEAPDSIYIDPRGKKQRTASGTSVDTGSVLIEDARLRKNFGTDGDIYHVHSSKPWVWGHEAAAAHERGDQKAIERHLQEMLSPLDTDLRNEKNLSALAERKKFQTDMRKKYFSLRKEAYERRLEALTEYKFNHPHFKDAWAHAVNDPYAKIFVSTTLDENPVTIEMIEQALRSDLSSSKSAGVFALVKRHDSKSIPLLEEVLNLKKENRLREVAAFAVSLRPDAPASLIEAILEDPRIEVRGQAASHLDRADLSFSSWKKALMGDDIRLRNAAIKGLKTRKDIPNALVEEILAGKDELAKPWALAALRGRNDGETTKILERASRDADEKVNATASQILAENSGKSACRDSLELLQNILPE